MADITFAEGSLFERHHPLQNHLVLENVFRYCDSVDLQTCALVSKFWKLLSRKLLRSRALVYINFSRKNQSEITNKFLDANEPNYDRQMYANFTLEGNLNSSLFKSFLGLFAVQVKQVQLFGCKFNKPHEFRHVMFNCFPNMETLELTHWNVIGKDQKCDMTESTPHQKLKRLTINLMPCLTDIVSWMELFNHFPRIQALEFPYILTPGADYSQMVDDAFLAINTIRKANPGHLNLKQLDVSHTPGVKESITPSLFKTLVDPRLQIEDLFLHIANNDSDVAKLPEILKVHRKSLKSLQLEKRTLGEEPQKFTTPFIDPVQSNSNNIFENLTYLRVHEYICGSLSFLKFTPILRKLTIETGSFMGKDRGSRGVFERTKFSDLQDVRLERCAEFSCDSALTSHDLLMLKALLPNVERLELQTVDNTNFHFVCLFWQNLTSLVIRDSTIDDCGLTGLDSEDVNIINGINVHHKPITVRQANITILKHLRHFWMEATLEKTVRLNCRSVLFCAAKLHCLQRLEIYKYMINKVPIDMIENERCGLKIKVFGGKKVFSYVKEEEDLHNLSESEVESDFEESEDEEDVEGSVEHDEVEDVGEELGLNPD